MTIGEATAVNVLLAFLLDETPAGLPREGRPSIRAVEAAGAELAKRAHKALYVGYGENDWREKWRKRTR